MRPHAQPSDTEEAKWRAEFEKLGRETVRVAILRGQGFTPDRKRELLFYGFGKKRRRQKAGSATLTGISNGRSWPPQPQPCLASS
jgi:hypothetical protein